MGLLSLTIAGLYAVRLRAVSKFAGTFPAIASIPGAYMLWPLQSVVWKSPGVQVNKFNDLKTIRNSLEI